MTSERGPLNSDILPGEDNQANNCPTYPGNQRMILFSSPAEVIFKSWEMFILDSYFFFSYFHAYTKRQQSLNGKHLHQRWEKVIWGYYLVIVLNRMASLHPGKEESTKSYSMIHCSGTGSDILKCEFMGCMLMETWKKKPFFNGIIFLCSSYTIWRRCTDKCIATGRHAFLAPGFCAPEFGEIMMMIITSLYKTFCKKN